MLAQPSDSSLGIRAVEWLRDNGARGLVNCVESIYYSFNAPSTGGPTLRALPNQPGVAASAAGALHHGIRSHHPPAIRPVIDPALPVRAPGVRRSPVAVRVRACW